MSRMGARLFGWEAVDAILVDSRFLKKVAWRDEQSNSSGYYEIREYMVELPDDAVRLTFTEKSIWLGTPAPKKGDRVKVKVNKKRTKAVFNRDAKRDSERQHERNRKAREAKKRKQGEERFARQLERRD